MLPELQKIHESPIKDDSELLRNQKTDFLTNFNNQVANGMRKSDDAMTNHSERTPKVTGGDLKGIMIHETTRTSFDRARNSVQAGQYPQQVQRYQTTPVQDHFNTEVAEDSLVIHNTQMGFGDMMPKPDFMQNFKQRSSQLRSQRELQLHNYRSQAAMVAK